MRYTKPVINLLFVKKRPMKIFTKKMVNFLFQDINECAEDPCQNDATCMDGINEYSCTCASGYTGFSCETGRFIQIDKYTCETCRLLNKLLGKCL